MKPIELLSLIVVAVASLVFFYTKTPRLGGVPITPVAVNVTCRSAYQSAIRATTTVSTGTTTVIVEVGDPIKYTQFANCIQADGTAVTIPLTFQQYADLAGKQTSLPTSAMSDVIVAQPSI